jgi:hypothetical protein
MTQVEGRERGGRRERGGKEGEGGEGGRGGITQPQRNTASQHTVHCTFTPSTSTTRGEEPGDRMLLSCRRAAEAYTVCGEEDV